MRVLRASHSGDLGLRPFIPPLLLGFLSSSFQIILLREFSAHFYGNELTLGIVLASWLLCAGLGSLLARNRHSARPLAGHFEWAVFFLPVSLAAVRLSRFAFRLLPGQQVGLAGTALAALATGLMVAFPLGRLFVENVKDSGGRLARVYVLESLGAAVGGVVLQWGLLPHFSNWQTASVAGGGGLALVELSAERRRLRPPLVIVGVLLAALYVFDQPTQKLYWKPFVFAAGQDTPYGKLQVIKTEDQVSFYTNGARAFSWPDPAAAEDAVHFSMLQDTTASAVLLIGGGAGGCLAELLKYPRVEVDYVELDPGLIRLARKFLGQDSLRALADEKVHVFYQDGRRFLQNSRAAYRMIILDLPGPATAQINRFYTREFFVLARQKLAGDGVFSFGIASSEDYIGRELQDLLSSLYDTLASVFPEVKVVPGERNIFLGSRRKLTIDPGELAARIRENHIETTYFNDAFLQSRLHPLRLRYLERRVSSGAGRPNTDLTPVTFFFESLFWSRQFRGPETAALRRLAAVPTPLLLGIPLIVLLPGFVIFRAKRARSAYLLVPVIITGLTTIIVEVMVLVWYQSLFGCLYGRIALLVSCFMFGLFAGSLAGSTAVRVSFGRLSLSMLGVTLVLAAFLALLPAPPPASLPCLILFLFGFLAGDIFIVANRLLLEARPAYGLGYGLELVGSFLGALVTSSLLIPLAGLPALTMSVLALNGLALAFLLTRPRGLSSSPDFLDSPPKL